MVLLPKGIVMSKQPNIDQWKELATKQLRGKPLDSLNWETPEGIDVKPLYTAEDMANMEHLGSLPGYAPAEFQNYYVNNHGAFVVSHAEFLGIHQYVQIHTTLNDPLNETLRSLHGTAEPYYVHAEFIWDFTSMISPMMEVWGARMGDGIWTGSCAAIVGSFSLTICRAL